MILPRNGSSTWPAKFDQVIRFFLYLLIFWLPYSSAAVEYSVILALLVWIAKRSLIFFSEQGPGTKRLRPFQRFLRAFAPAESFLNRPIFYFLGACALSVFFSQYIAQSWHNFLTKTVEWFVIYFLVIEVFREKKHFLTALMIFLFTSAAVGLDAHIQYYLTQKDIFLGRPIAHPYRATAAFKAPNFLGAYYCVLLPFMAGLISRQSVRMWQRAVIFVLTGISGSALILSYSRAAWLAVFAGILLYAVLFTTKAPRGRRYFGRIVVPVLIACCVAGLFVLKSSLDQDMMDRASAHWRAAIWKDSLELVREKPVFGFGINTFMSVLQDHRREEYLRYNRRIATYAHNCYLQLWVETGTLGLLTFLWLLFKFAVVSIRMMSPIFTLSPDWAKGVAGLFAGLSGFLIHSFFDTNFYTLQLSAYFWVTMGITVALLQCQPGNQDKAQGDSYGIG